jgi:hypothetical protein
MNRRTFIAGTMALAGHGPLLRSMSSLSIADQSATPRQSPQNLLTSTFTEEFLTSKLLPVDAWHPYPRWGERAGWQAVPADIHARIVAQAEADLQPVFRKLAGARFSRRAFSNSSGMATARAMKRRALDGGTS